MTSSLEDSIALLKMLDGEMHINRPPRHSGEKPGRNRPWEKLTATEWENVKKAIEEHELPCFLAVTPYGFTFHVCGQSDAQEIQPETLVVIESSQFPFQNGTGKFASQEEILATLASITHRARNHELLAWYGFSPLLPIESYAY